MKPIIIFLCALAILFSAIRLGYTYTNEADFYVYIPDNLTITKEKNFLGWDTHTSKCDVITANNSTLNIYTPSDLNKLLPYRGKYVILTLAFGNSDDESGYAKWIKNIQVQNDSKLGYYPNGIDDWDYYHHSPIQWWDCIGFLGFIPLLLFIILRSRKEEKIVNDVIE